MVKNFAPHLAMFFVESNLFFAFFLAHNLHFLECSLDFFSDLKILPHSDLVSIARGIVFSFERRTQDRKIILDNLPKRNLTVICEELMVKGAIDEITIIEMHPMDIHHAVVMNIQNFSLPALSRFIYTKNLVSGPEVFYRLQSRIRKYIGIFGQSFVEPIRRKIFKLSPQEIHIPVVVGFNRPARLATAVLKEHLLVLDEVLFLLLADRLPDLLAVDERYVSHDIQDAHYALLKDENSVCAAQYVPYAFRDRILPLFPAFLSLDITLVHFET